MEPRPDEFFRELVGAFTGAGANVDVTLLVNGRVVMGAVQGPHVFRDGLRDQLASAFQRATPDIEPFARQVSDRVAAVLAAREGGAPSDDECLHLASVTVWDGTTKFRLARLRVRYADISAWTFGRPSSDDD